MSAEIWTMIGVGIGISTVFGAIFTLLNMRISDLRKDMQDIAKNLSEEIVRSEKRTNDRIDGLEKNLGARIDGVEAKLGARIDGVEAKLGARIDGVEARIDSVETRLRAVEQGQARVIGAVEMMQTIVVATLRGEEVGAD